MLPLSFGIQEESHSKQHFPPILSSLFENDFEEKKEWINKHLRCVPNIINSQRQEEEILQFPLPKLQ